MPIISSVEARSFRGRLLYAMMFAVLILGSITMIYPFMIMVSGSLRSELDQTDLDVLPRFLISDEVLYRKFVETKYNQDVMRFNQQQLRQDFAFRSAAVPDAVNAKEVALFREWLAADDMPAHWISLGGIFGVRTTPENLRELRRRLSQEYNDDLEAFGEAIGNPLSSWTLITLRPPEWLSQRYDAVENPVTETYLQMMREAPPAELQLESLSGFFLASMIYPVYGQLDTAVYNKVHTTKLKDFSDFRLPRTVPADDPILRKEWMEFVTSELHPSFIQVQDADEAEWHAYLRERHGEIEEVNNLYKAEYRTFEEIPLPQGRWLSGIERQDYRGYLNTLEAERLILIGPEYAWRESLLNRFGGLAALNTALGTAYESPESILPPMAQLEERYVDENKGQLRLKYALRNYVNVFDELFLRGRAFINTVIFCFLAVVSALLINPMAAYAMSRTKLPGTYKILMILMATVAFPPMVATIPQFILLRETHLLNTFVALVLPSLANGYLIFLLKGFFDSLPAELYEAATIDGASESRIFFQITMSLSKPILAVVALGAFNGAYGAFLYPLIVAPKEEMWVLNVWMYQWQQTSSTSAMFASVLIASIPTLVVFLVAQNIIMRGIVVPTEK